jgi:biofilm PGA synthesis N-glycosyltransferase PgaC
MPVISVLPSRKPMQITTREDRCEAVMTAQNLTYVLITPARNEADLIEQTIQSVISQTVLPKKWVIVSDGSTDGTDEIVQKYLADYPWMELVRMPERTERHFGAKVRSFNAGYHRAKDLSFDIVGNLDADITFDKQYFDFLLSKFGADSLLGVVGTPFVEGTTSYDFRFTSVEHVSGACQLFRRQCFEDIGGYTPVKGGGIDWIAVTTARMKGWKTRTFVEQVCHHHRPMGTASAGRLEANFKLGRQDYYLGGHPLWQLVRGCYQMVRSPYLLGGLFLLAGYGWAWITRAPRPISAELIQFHQGEQMHRLRQSLVKTIGIASVSRASSQS